MDEECLRSIQESTTLAEHFQNIVDDCKVTIKQVISNIIFIAILMYSDFCLANFNIFVF